MPNTRASTRRLASKRKLGEDTATSDDDLMHSTRHVQEEIEAETRMSIMDNLRETRSGVEQLYTRIRSLEQENGSLKSELRQVQKSVYNGAGRSSRSRTKASRREIQSLERAIVDLKAAREKDRRTIEKLRDKEVERDAKELAEDHDGAVPTQQTADLGDNAIKLLGRICHTIDMNTLAEGEECAICMEQMEVEKCYSLPCQHPLCVGCFERLCNGANALPNVQTSSAQCPHCRDICERDECEIITHTAVQQWDLLLDISREWAAMDVGEIDIAEDDDDEDSFIDDDSVAATESPLPEALREGADLDPEISAASTSADDTGLVAYKSLPSPSKRKRLLELVAQRSVKPRPWPVQFTQSSCRGGVVSL